jgi:hypothetical protein
MPLYNFSDLQVSTSASNNDQILLRLNNSLSGEEGFSRITFSKFENSLNFLKSGGTINGNVTINGTLSSNFIRATSANIDIVNITNYELSGFSILSGGLTVQGTISSNNVVYASGGNSNQWNSAFTTVQNSSGNWDGVSSLSATAWVDKLGNDSTGEIGNIQKPYLTMQSAFNAGAKMFHIGLGTFDGISTAGNIDISFIGSGLNKTTITSIAASNSISSSYTVNVQDLGVQSASIGNINSIGVNSDNPSYIGGTGGHITINNIKVVGIDNNGGSGANGTFSSTNGSNGGNGGLISVYGTCFVTSIINNYGGNGGIGYDTGDGYGSNGNGGNGGTISGDTLYADTITSNGGSAGYNAGAFPASGGDAAAIALKNLESSSVNINAGSSSGSFLTDKSGGTLILKKGSITNLSIDKFAAGSEGIINGHCIFVENITAGSPTINAVISNIAGSPYGT